MRSIKFDQLGRKAPSPPPVLLAAGATALVAGPSLAQVAIAEPGLSRPASRPPEASDAAVSAGSPKP